ncbi:MAG: flagellar basal-body MS-ring/collar protein FliF [Bacillota bacterium]|nr:flagellar basal-body MS-ring/collar protein FliF [Bacillota bacterium]
MPEFIKKLQSQIKEFWKNLDKSQKSRIIIISSIIIIATTVFIIIVTKPNYVPLIRNASAQDIGSMTKILDTSNIKYNLQDNNTSIYVNAGDNNKAQVTLLQSGYPKGGMTFDDAFSMIKINSTDSDRDAIWQQYKKSTLLSKLREDFKDVITDVDVDLAIPETEYFLTSENNQSKTTAYVKVTPVSELSSDQVHGIVEVVSHSVANLDPKDVTVVDNNLNVLNTDTGDVATDTNTQEKLIQKKTTDLEKKVYDLFNNGQVDNFDTIRVIANPILDFNKQQSVTNSIANPDGMDTGALITNKETSEQATSPNGSGGTPGTQTNPGTGNTPSYPNGSSQNGSYSNTSKDQAFDYNRTTTTLEKSMGDVTDKSSMTVLLYYGRRVPDDTKLTSAFITQLTNDVSKATGVPAANISVNKYKLAQVAVTKVPIGDTISKLINSYGFFALMLLLIIGLMISAIPKKKPVLQTEDAALGQAAAAGAATGPRFIVPEPTEHIPEIEIEERSEVKKQIEKFVKQKPDAVAQLLRNWLSEDWE